MSGYITTNIRLPEEDYLRLKEEAFKKRESLSAIIREKIGAKRLKGESPEEIIAKIRKHASENARYIEGVDIVKTVREMRNKGKW